MGGPGSFLSDINQAHVRHDFFDVLSADTGVGGEGGVKMQTHTHTRSRSQSTHATPTCFLGHRGSKRTVSPLVFLFFILIS